MSKEGNLLSIPIDEQETTITFLRAEHSAVVWTNDRTMITKLDKMCEKFPASYVCTDIRKTADTGEVMDKRYRIADKTLLSFRGVKIKHELTEEQKDERRARLMKIKEARS